MEEKKNNNMLTIILFVLLLIAVGVICYLLGSNSNKENKTNNNEIKEEVKEPIVENNEDSEKIEEETIITPVVYTPKCVDSSQRQNTLMTDIDVTKYNNIFEYIQEQKNVKILINHCKSDETNPSADSNGFVAGTYELDNSEKELVLREMKKSTFEISKSGIGGACVSGLTITYERNDEEYDVSYYQLFAMTSNDGNIYRILDKSVNNTLAEPQNCLYKFNNLSSTATSVLNRLKNN